MLIRLNSKSEKKIIQYKKELEHYKKNVTPPKNDLQKRDTENNFAIDAAQKEIFDTIENSTQNFFIQGQAGTGKSYFITYLKNHTSKKLAIACPTAIAALHIGGVTLHSLFMLPPSDFFAIQNLKFSLKTLEILKKIEVLIIDEISMVRPDMLDAIDAIAKEARGNEEPFGGLQLLLIGDLFQLPPIIKNDVRPLFKKEYGIDTPFFFDAPTFIAGKFKTVIFTKVYRQSDDVFLHHLRNIRRNFMVDDSLEYFNSTALYNTELFKNAVTITTRNAIASSVNNEKLAELYGEQYVYTGKIEGNFDICDAPAPQILKLKVGAMVLFNRNISPDCINGTSAIVTKLADDSVDVQLTAKGIPVSVFRQKWVKLAYVYDSENDAMKEIEIGTFMQFPLQLGYAMTIHKAQGMTLDKAVLDLRGGTFAHGHLYVALSRTRTKTDMRVAYPLSYKHVIFDKRVENFLQSEVYAPTAGTTHRHRT